jgi:hypothetical protein
VVCGGFQLRSSPQGVGLQGSRGAAGKPFEPRPPEKKTTRDPRFIPPGRPQGRWVTQSRTDKRHPDPTRVAASARSRVELPWPRRSARSILDMRSASWPPRQSPGPGLQRMRWRHPGRLGQAMRAGGCGDGEVLRQKKQEVSRQPAPNVPSRHPSLHPSKAAGTSRSLPSARGRTPTKRGGRARPGTRTGPDGRQSPSPRGQGRLSPPESRADPRPHRLLGGLARASAAWRWIRSTEL